MVKSKFIKIELIKDLQKFVDKASNVEGEVLVQKDYWIVNGKSILGILSLDFSNGVTVTYPANEWEFEQFLDEFEIEK